MFEVEFTLLSALAMKVQKKNSSEKGKMMEWQVAPEETECDNLLTLNRDQETCWYEPENVINVANVARL